VEREGHFQIIKREPAGEGPDLSYVNLYELIQQLKEGKLEKDYNNAKKVLRKKLIDHLNYINFSDGKALIIFKHSKYTEIITRLVAPEPCQEASFFGRWSQSADFGETLRELEVLGFMLEFQREIILAPSKKLEINPEGIHLSLPDFGFEIFLRKADRYPGYSIQTQMIQSGVLFPGRLTVFSVKAFELEVEAAEGVSLKWINEECPVQIIFKDDQEIFYSRECQIIKQSGHPRSKTLVLQPHQKPINRFKRREFRASRQTINPSPGVYFIHPLINKLIKLNISDLSTSGFSVEEETEASTLLPGLIIPDMQMELVNGTTLSCKAQVIYKNSIDDHVVKSGFSILNMSNGDYIKLTNLVNKSMNNNLDICGTISLDSLWQFFFQSGFIYPQKYHHIQQNKEAFKKLYQRIYNHPTEVERHITYQERGALLGHISMLHLYDATWMLHHFTATPNSRYKKVALTLLHQIERYIIDSHYFESSHMDHIVCYFRPENKFPNQVFGGAARALKDPRICSLDRFAYLVYPMLLSSGDGGLPASWSLSRSSREDLAELAHFYTYSSGGQMLEALDLDPEQLGNQRLDNQYHQAGFARERLLLSLKKHHKVKAVFSLIKTDMGLNLSELTNCLSVFVLEPEDLPFEVFVRALSQMSEYDERHKIPILLYPIKYAERQSIAFERVYDLWVFGVDNSDYYFNYINRLFSRLFS
jgi:hypothetical protein